jgi:hypothetical protein
MYNKNGAPYRVSYQKTPVEEYLPNRWLLPLIQVPAIKRVISPKPKVTMAKYHFSASSGPPISKATIMDINIAAGIVSQSLLPS